MAERKRETYIKKYRNLGIAVITAAISGITLNILDNNHPITMHSIMPKTDMYANQDGSTIVYETDFGQLMMTIVEVSPEMYQQTKVLSAQSYILDAQKIDNPIDKSPEDGQKELPRGIIYVGLVPEDTKIENGYKKRSLNS